VITQEASTGKREALLVASDAYSDSALSRLAFPQRDVEALGRVLGDAAIGAYDVVTSINEDRAMLLRRIDEILNDGTPDDLALLHFSGHVLSDDDHTYFLTQDADSRRPAETGIPMDLLRRYMDESPAGGIVVLLDGSFIVSDRGKIGRPVAPLNLPDLRVNVASGARAILSAGTGTETSDRELSSFIASIVQGLESGAADRDGDGVIDVDELYEYVAEKMTMADPGRRPAKLVYGASKTIVIARSRIATHQPALRLPGFAADATEGVDLLGVRSRVDFLSSVLAARHLETPLAIGLFGDWGSGKSFFMRRLQERIGLLTERSAQAEEQDEPTLYCSHVRQVTFNAWLYADSDIWPSFAAQVFRSVTGAAEDVPSGHIQAGHLAEYQEEVESLEATRSEAEREEAVLDRRLTEVDAEIEAKRVEIQTRAEAIGPEAGAAAKLVADLGEISHRLLSLVRNWRSIRASDLVMLAVPVAVGVSAVFFDWARILAVLAVVGGFVALVLSSLRYVERTRALRHEIVDLERQKQQLQEERQERARRRATAELSLGDAVELPLLPQFAEDQAARWLGRQQLGVVTEIRLAFERLSKMIDEGRAAGRQTAGERGNGLPIDRVIIYVDDLDRCPHDVVVRVLETIKVLLDLRHFVVVVGVDSRWLFRSIQVHFSKLLHPEAGSDDDAVWAATPQNYLEKIFQYSIVLRPIDAAGFERLIGSLLRVEDEVAKGAAGESLSGAVAAEPEDAPPEERRARAEATAPEVSERLRTDSTASEAGMPPPEFDLTPGDLVITRDELDFMRRLAPLFATPRAAKRLVNIYRLLRVSAGAERLERRKAYEYALVLLSLTIAFPALAGDVFRMIARKTQEDWSALLDSLQPRPSDPPGRIENELSSELSPSEAAAWAKLVGALRTIQWADPQGPPLGAFDEWTAIVAEYSFHPWQDLLPAGTRG
jgi:hypothetical protein